MTAVLETSGLGKQYRLAWIASLLGEDGLELGQWVTNDRAPRLDGSLAVALVGHGAGRVPAVAAALAYCLVSFWLVIAVGWISVAVIAHQLRRLGRRCGASGPGPGPQASGALPPE